MRMVVVSGLVSLALLSSTLVIGGCASGGRSAPAAGAPSPVGEWRLVEMDGEAMEPPEGARAPTLTVHHDGSVGGMAGINRFSGSVDVDAWNDSAWALGATAMTRMGGTPEAMAFEQRYMAMLGRASSMHFKRQLMTLRDDGDDLLRFQRVGE